MSVPSKTKAPCFPASMLPMRSARPRAAAPFTAITLNGAAALGRADRIGSIEAGKQGDFVLLGTDNPHILPYYTGMNAVKLTIKGGRILNSN